jgi:hypothetical protein
MPPRARPAVLAALAFAAVAVVAAPVGCGGPRAAARGSSEGAASTNAPASATVPRDPCADVVQDVVITAAPTDARCADGDLGRCLAKVPVTIRNCSAGPIVIEWLDVKTGSGHSTDYAGPIEVTPPELARGGTKEHTLDLDPGRHQIVLVHHACEPARADADADAAPAPRRVATLDVEVACQAREAAQTKCDACRGELGPYGTSGSWSCDCGTNDGGKICRDGEECEGGCEFNHFEMVVPEGPLRCDAKGCARSPALGRMVGACSARRLTVHDPIPRGASNSPPGRMWCPRRPVY